MSDPTGPTISEDTSMREEISVTELNVLLKFLQTWRTAVEAQLRTTRKVVITWWQWSYASAEIYYNHWLELPLLQRNQIKISDDFALRLRWTNMEQM